MVERETLLRYEAVGQRLETCDICGQETLRATTVIVDGDREGTEPIEQIRICPACRDRMYRDELGVDDELTPNIEPADD